ncbi:tetracycline resistance [Fusarium pseudocircinatum]|uniref:Tetracycline resistance n=1 Tax=Fusarium pseudocircinatum TaxID=56676 RepID=A0A8H5KWG8_9HYPO|nr:tetracycline resistance [Fusarium pseudocircinatum]
MGQYSLGIAPNQSLQNSATSEETPPTFHLFSRLPPESRLTIWKAACLPYSDFEGGLHYVTVDAVHTHDPWRKDCIHPVDDPNLEGHEHNYEGSGYVTMRALEYPWGKTSNSLSPVNLLNKSAYLWDAGLWLACKESREVVLKHLQFKELLACRQQPLQKDELAWYYKDFPSAIVPQNKNEEWRPLVKPCGDIFCIDASNLESVPGSSLDMMLLAPFFGTKKFTVVGGWNIAFKFDRSWNDNLPSSWDDLMDREDSVRSRLATSLFYEVSAVDEFPSLWLIDDNVRWIARSREKCSAVWRDLEGEYVEINWDETRSNMVDGTQGAVTNFIDALQQLADNDHYFYDSSPLSLSLRLLIRRENQLPGCIDEDVESKNENGDESEDPGSDGNDGGDNSDE